MGWSHTLGKCVLNTKFYYSGIEIDNNSVSFSLTHT